MPDSSDSNGWRPIETAPGDKSLLLWRDSGVTVGCYDTDLDEWRDCAGFLMAADPIYWQPLPAPPRAEDDR